MFFDLVLTHCVILCGTVLCTMSMSIGNTARSEMMKSKLPSSVLRRIWALSNIDQDGQLDRDEFAVAMFLIDHKLAGNDLPDVIPERLVPPSKRSIHRAAQGHFGGGGGGGGMGQDRLGPSSSYSGELELS